MDALDEQPVSAALDRVVQEAGSLDVLLNVAVPRPQEFGNGTNRLELPLAQLLLPLTRLVPAQFITGRAAARHLVQQRSGVILFLTVVPARGLATVTAIGSASGAMESLTRCLAADLGPAGVRVVGIRSGAMAETRTIQQSAEIAAQRLSVPKERVVSLFEQATRLKRLRTVNATAQLAAFLALDGARTITGAIVNASSGSVMD